VQLVDANVLLHAVNSTSTDHGAARTTMERLLSGPEPVAFTWVALLAFLRISTRPGVFARPLAIDEALGYVDEWLEQPASIIVGATHRHLSILSSLLRAVGTAGNLTTDAHLAALAIEHDAQVVSFDADFGRFPGLRWRTPEPG
jgi:toxin-antitoxin system PIN domain toxin